MMYLAVRIPVVRGNARQRRSRLFRRVRRKFLRQLGAEVSTMEAFKFMAITGVATFELVERES